MTYKKLPVLVLCIVLLSAGMSFAVNAGTPGNSLEDDIVVEEFSVNGEEEKALIELQEETEIYAEVTNNMDEEIEMVVTIEDEDGEVPPGPHSYEETVGPGETGYIDEEYEEHDGWYPGEFVVRLHVEDHVDEIIDVTVYDEVDITVNVFEVNGEDEEVEIGLDEEMELYAEVENQGDVKGQIALKVEGETHKGYIYEVETGETKVIEETFEHATWDEGEYSSSLGDKTVIVNVEEDIEDEEEVPGFTFALLAIAAVVGVALYEKKKH